VFIILFIVEHNRRLIALDETSIRLLAVNDGFHAIQLLLASERIQDDLISSLSLNLIIRQFIIDRRKEANNHWLSLINNF